MNNVVKTAFLSAFLLSFFAGADLKAGPITGGIGAGMVLGAGAMWGWLKGPALPLPVPVPSGTGQLPVVVSSVLVTKTEYVGNVAKLAAVVGWIGAFLPLP